MVENHQEKYLNIIKSIKENSDFSQFLESKKISNKLQTDKKNPTTIEDLLTKILQYLDQKQYEEIKSKLHLHLAKKFAEDFLVHLPTIVQIYENEQIQPGNDLSELLLEIKQKLEEKDIQEEDLKNTDLVDHLRSFIDNNDVSNLKQFLKGEELFKEYEDWKEILDIFHKHGITKQYPFLPEISLLVQDKLKQILEELGLLDDLKDEASNIITLFTDKTTNFEHLKNIKDFFKEDDWIEFQNRVAQLIIPFLFKKFDFNEEEFKDQNEEFKDQKEEQKLIIKLQPEQKELLKINFDQQNLLKKQKILQAVKSNEEFTKFVEQRSMITKFQDKGILDKNQNIDNFIFLIQEKVTQNKEAELTSQIISNNILASGFKSKFEELLQKVKQIIIEEDQRCRHQFIEDSIQKALSHYRLSEEIKSNEMTQRLIVATSQNSMDDLKIFLAYEELFDKLDDWKTILDIYQQYQIVQKYPFHPEYSIKLRNEILKILQQQGLEDQQLIESYGLQNIAKIFVEEQTDENVLIKIQSLFTIEDWDAFQKKVGTLIIPFYFKTHEFNPNKISEYELSQQLNENQQTVQQQQKIQKQEKNQQQEINQYSTLKPGLNENQEKNQQYQQQYEEQKQQQQQQFQKFSITRDRFTESEMQNNKEYLDENKQQEKKQSILDIIKFDSQEQIKKQRIMLMIQQNEAFVTFCDRRGIVKKLQDQGKLDKQINLNEFYNLINEKLNENQDEYILNLVSDVLAPKFKEEFNKLLINLKTLIKEEEKKAKNQFIQESIQKILIHYNLDDVINYNEMFNSLQTAVQESNFDKSNQFLEYEEYFEDYPQWKSLLDFISACKISDKYPFKADISTKIQDVIKKLLKLFSIDDQDIVNLQNIVRIFIDDQTNENELRNLQTNFTKSEWDEFQQKIKELILPFQFKTHEFDPEKQIQQSISQTQSFDEQKNKIMQQNISMLQIEVSQIQYQKQQENEEQKVEQKISFVDTINFEEKDLIIKQKIVQSIQQIEVFTKFVEQRQILNKLEVKGTLKQKSKIEDLILWMHNNIVKNNEQEIFQQINNNLADHFKNIFQEHYQNVKQIMLNEQQKGNEQFLSDCINKFIIHLKLENELKSNEIVQCLVQAISFNKIDELKKFVENEKYFEDYQNWKTLLDLIFKSGFTKKYLYQSDISKLIHDEIKKILSQHRLEDNINISTQKIVLLFLEEQTNQIELIKLQKLFTEQDWDTFQQQIKTLITPFQFKTHEFNPNRIVPDQIEEYKEQKQQIKNPENEKKDLGYFYNIQQGNEKQPQLQLSQSFITDEDQQKFLSGDEFNEKLIQQQQEQNQEIRHKINPVQDKKQQINQKNINNDDLSANFSINIKNQKMFDDIYQQILIFIKPIHHQDQQQQQFKISKGLQQKLTNLAAEYSEKFDSFEETMSILNNKQQNIKKQISQNELAKEVKYIKKYFKNYNEIPEKFGLDAFWLSELMKKCQENNNKIRKQDCLMFMGVTGAGKSTCINTVLGAIPFIETLKDGLDVISFKNPFTKVGHENISCTFLVHGYELELELKNYLRNLMILDCPGTHDSRGVEIVIANSLSVAFALQDCNSLIPILVFNIKDIESGRAKFFKDTIDTLCDLISKQTKDDYLTILNSSIFIFTKVSEGEEKKVIALIKTQISTYQKQIQESKDQIEIKKIELFIVFIENMIDQISKNSAIMFDPFRSKDRFAQILEEKQFLTGTKIKFKTRLGLQEAEAKVQLMITHIAKKIEELQSNFNIKEISFYLKLINDLQRYSKLENLTQYYQEIKQQVHANFKKKFNDILDKFNYFFTDSKLAKDSDYLNEILQFCIIFQKIQKYFSNFFEDDELNQISSKELLNQFSSKLQTLINEVQNQSDLQQEESVINNYEEQDFQNEETEQSNESFLQLKKQKSQIQDFNKQNFQQCVKTLENIQQLQKFLSDSVNNKIEDQQQKQIIYILKDEEKNLIVQFLKNLKQQFDETIKQIQNNIENLAKNIAQQVKTLFQFNNDINNQSIQQKCQILVQSCNLVFSKITLLKNEIIDDKKFQQIIQLFTQQLLNELNKIYIEFYQFLENLQQLRNMKDEKENKQKEIKFTYKIFQYLIQEKPYPELEVEIIQTQKKLKSTIIQQIDKNIETINQNIQDYDKDDKTIHREQVASLKNLQQYFLVVSQLIDIDSTLHQDYKKQFQEVSNLIKNMLIKYEESQEEIITNLKTTIKDRQNEKFKDTSVRIEGQQFKKIIKHLSFWKDLQWIDSDTILNIGFNKIFNNAKKLRKYAINYLVSLQDLFKNNLKQLDKDIEAIQYTKESSSNYYLDQQNIISQQLQQLEYLKQIIDDLINNHMLKNPDPEFIQMLINKQIIIEQKQQELNNQQNPNLNEQIQKQNIIIILDQDYNEIKNQIFAQEMFKRTHVLNKIYKSIYQQSQQQIQDEQQQEIKQQKLNKEQQKQQDSDVVHIEEYISLYQTSLKSIDLKEFSNHVLRMQVYDKLFEEKKQKKLWSTQFEIIIIDTLTQYYYVIIDFLIKNLDKKLQDLFNILKKEECEQQLEFLLKNISFLMKDIIGLVNLESFMILQNQNNFKTKIEELQNLFQSFQTKFNSIYKKTGQEIIHQSSIKDKLKKQNQYQFLYFSILYLKSILTSDQQTKYECPTLAQDNFLRTFNNLITNNQLDKIQKQDIQKVAEMYQTYQKEGNQDNLQVIQNIYKIIFDILDQDMLTYQHEIEFQIMQYHSINTEFITKYMKLYQDSQKWFPILNIYNKNNDNNQQNSPNQLKSNIQEKQETPQSPFSTSRIKENNDNQFMASLDQYMINLIEFIVSMQKNFINNFLWKCLNQTSHDLISNIDNEIFKINMIINTTQKSQDILKGFSNKFSSYSCLYKIQNIILDFQKMVNEHIVVQEIQMILFIKCFNLDEGKLKKIKKIILDQCVKNNFIDQLNQSNNLQQQDQTFEIKYYYNYFQAINQQIQQIKMQINNNKLKIFDPPIDLYFEENKKLIITSQNIEIISKLINYTIQMMNDDENHIKLSLEDQKKYKEQQFKKIIENSFAFLIVIKQLQKIYSQLSLQMEQAQYQTHINNLYEHLKNTLKNCLDYVDIDKIEDFIKFPITSNLFKDEFFDQIRKDIIEVQIEQKKIKKNSEELIGSVFEIIKTINIVNNNIDQLNKFNSKINQFKKIQSNTNKKNIIENQKFCYQLFQEFKNQQARNQINFEINLQEMNNNQIITTIFQDCANILLQDVLSSTFIQESLNEHDSDQSETLLSSNYIFFKKLNKSTGNSLNDIELFWVLGIQQELLTVEKIQNMPDKAMDLLNPLLANEKNYIEKVNTYLEDLIKIKDVEKNIKDSSIETACQLIQISEKNDRIIEIFINDNKGKLFISKILNKLETKLKKQKPDNLIKDINSFQYKQILVMLSNYLAIDLKNLQSLLEKQEFQKYIQIMQNTKTYCKNLPPNQVDFIQQKLIEIQKQQNQQQQILRYSIFYEDNVKFHNDYYVQIQLQYLSSFKEAFKLVVDHIFHKNDLNYYGDIQKIEANATNVNKNIQNNLSLCNSILKQTQTLNLFPVELKKSLEEFSIQLKYEIKKQFSDLYNQVITDNNNIKQFSNYLIVLYQIQDNVYFLKESIYNEISTQVSAKAKNQFEELEKIANDLSDQGAHGEEIIQTFPIFSKIQQKKFIAKVKTINYEQAIQQFQMRDNKNNKLKNFESDKIKQLKAKADEFDKRFLEIRRKYTGKTDSLSKDINASFVSIRKQIQDEGLVQNIKNVLNYLSMVKLEIKEEIISQMAAIFALWSLEKDGGDQKLDLSSGNQQDCYIQKPHPSQVLSIILIESLDTDDNVHKDKKQNNVLNQIKTGEGKSITLGVSAIINALLGFNVFVVSYSKYLSERDFSDFESIFKKLGIYDQIRYGTFQDMSRQIIDQDINIRESTLNLVEKFCGNSSIKFQTINQDKGLVNKGFFSKCQILIDEVDVFFTEDFYGKAYQPITLIQHQLFDNLLWDIWLQRDDLLKKSQEEASYSVFKKHQNNIINQFPGIEAILELNIFLMIKALHDLRSTKYQYKIATNSQNKQQIAYVLQDTLNFQQSYGYLTTWHYAQLVNQKEIDRAKFSEYAGIFISCGSFSYAKMVNTQVFSIIKGVSGTLENINPIIKNILRDQYNINKEYYCPSMFGDSKLSWSHDHLFLEKDKAALFYQITNIIQNKKKDQNQLPILVVFINQTILNEFELLALNNQWIQKDKYQILSTDKTFQQKEKIVKISTKMNSITLLTREFGRGTDFKCYDTAVTSDKGVTMIQTFLSENINEEIQIKGRVARQQDPGYYYLALSMDDPELLKFITNEYLSQEIEQNNFQIYQYIDQNEQTKIQLQQKALTKHKSSNTLYKFLNEKRNTYYEQQIQTFRDLQKGLESKHAESQQYLEFVSKQQSQQAFDQLVKWNSQTFCKYHFLIFIDDSGSMSGTRWNQAKQASCNFIDNIAHKFKQSFLSLLQFNGDCIVKQEFKKIQQQQGNQFSFRSGGTDFDPPFAKAAEFINKYKSQVSMSIILFYTDGQAGYPSNAVKTLKQLQQNNIKFSTYLIVEASSSCLSKLTTDINNCTLQTNISPEKLDLVFTNITTLIPEGQL